MLNIKRMFLDNSILGFRDSHVFLSVLVRHPRSEVTRVQRVSILMCGLMVAMLCSIMFYAPNEDDIPTDEFQYDVGMRELIISVQTLLISAGLTLIVLISFKRSYKVVREHTRTTKHFRKDQIAEQISKSALSEKPQQHSGKTFYQNYVEYVSKYFKEPPFAPVFMWDDQKRVLRRKLWYILAWSSCIIIILGTSYLVMLYGLKLGFIQSQQWLTSLIMSTGEDIFVMTPGRIIFIAILLSMAFQISTQVDLYGISVKDAMLARPKNDISYLNILLSKRGHPMYAPLSSSARHVLLKKKEIRRKWWNLIDFINALCFVIVVSAVNYRLWISHYHEVSHLRNLFSESHMKQFGAVDIKHINNVTLVENYMQITFIEILFNLWWYNKQLLQADNQAEGIRKYWLSDGIYKPISRPHVRQVRVVPYDCRIPYMSGNNESKCLLKWSLMNKDDNIYGEKWVPATYLDTTKENSPWVYVDKSTALWWTNQRFYGTYGNLYDVSGYETFLGPSLFEAQKTLVELEENRWQDWYTRACFLSVTVYNVNDQTFSQITTLFEYFVDGSMHTRIQVVPVSRNVLVGVWEYIFFLYAIYYVCRSGYLINRMGLMDYLKTINNICRVVNVFLAFLAIIIWCIHHRTSIKYSENYMKHMKSDHFDFDKFIKTFRILKLVLSLLLCLAIARAFMLLRGGRRLLNIYYALVIMLILIFWLGVGFILLILFFMRLQYLLSCQEYFRVKELVLPNQMTAFVRTSFFEKLNLDIFLTIRVVFMFVIKGLFLILFLYHTRIAKAYKPRRTDQFNFVLFVIERVKKCCGGRHLNN